MAIDQIDIRRQTDNLLEKHTYFLLGAVGACIAFAFSQSKDLRFEYSLLGWALAILCWATSFYFGCWRINSIVKSNLLNIQLSNLSEDDFGYSNDSYSKFKNHQDFVSNAAYKCTENAAKLYTWQYSTFILGVAVYFSWHLYRIYLNC